MKRHRNHSTRSTPFSVDAMRMALLASLALLGACGGRATVDATGGNEGETEAGAGDATVEAEASLPLTDDPAGDAPAEGSALDAPIDEAHEGGLPESGVHACDDPTPLVVGGVDTGIDACGAAGGPNVYMRRRTPTVCPSGLPRASGGACAETLHSSTPSTCASDTDCASDPDGHCELTAADGGIIPSCACVHGCQTDAECGLNEVCVCGDPVGRCVRASCTSSADCAPGLDCITTAIGPDCAPTFDCQTPDDECTTAADCSADAGPAQTCVAQGGVHRCEPVIACGL